MIHPQYWSLNSIWRKLNGLEPYEAIGKEDKEAYALLPVKGRIVLDIGAYDGDSAAFFLKRGARRVICIEPDPNRCKMIERRRREKWFSARVYCKKFSEEDLTTNIWDCAKIDCEGYEALLYEKGWHRHIGNRPVILEAHNWHIAEELEKVGFKRIKLLDPMLGLCLMAKNISLEGEP